MHDKCSYHEKLYEKLCPLWQEISLSNQDPRWTSARIMGHIYDITDKDHILDLNG